MKDNKKYKLVLTGFVIMLILNIAVLASLWILARKRPYRHEGNRSLRVQQFIKHELNLSKGQQKAFGELRREHIRRTKGIVRDMQAKRSQLVDVLKIENDSLRSAKADSITTLIGGDQTRMEQAVFNHFFHLRQLCDKEQKKKFDRIMQEVLRRFSPNYRNGKENSVSKQ